MAERGDYGEWQMILGRQGTEIKAQTVWAEDKNILKVSQRVNTMKDDDVLAEKWGSNWSLSVCGSGMIG